MKQRQSFHSELNHPASPWDLPSIVEQLRAARQNQTSDNVSEQKRHELPSREALVDIVNKLRAALFPSHFGKPDLSDEGLDFFVGYTLDTTLQSLAEQIRRAIHFTGDCASTDETCAKQAISLTMQFAQQLPQIRMLLESDIRAAFDGDPAAKTLDEVVFCYPGIAAITHHRLAHALYKLGIPLLARIVSEIAHSDTGIDIHPGATIGSSFFIDHGTGVVIGETAILGQHVRIYQGVTLGAKSFPIDEHGVLLKGAPRHPVLEDHVVVYAGATILGRVTIGEGSSIGGNVWLTRSVPAHSHITQGQPRAEVFNSGGGI